MALCLHSSAVAQNYLEDYLPSTTLLSISLKDSEAIQHAFEDGALSKVIPEAQKDEWLQQYKEPITDAEGEHYILPSGEELSFYNLNQLLNKRLCVGVVSLETDEDMQSQLVLLADFAGDIDALKFLQTADREAEPGQVLLIEENYAGVTLFTEELDLPEDEWMAEYWALVDGIAIEATSMELLKNTVDAIIDQRGVGLGNSKHFLRAVDLAPTSQFRVFMNLDEGVELVRKMMESDMGDLPMNPLAVTSESLWASLSLESLNAVFIGLDLESEVLESTFGVLYDQRDGVLSLLDYSQEPLRLPHWIPTDAIESTVAMIDFSGAFSALEGIMNQMSPNFGSMFQLQLDNLKQQTDIDFRESIINNFGDQFISFTVWEDMESEEVALMEEPEKMVIAIPLRDPQAFQNSVKALTEIFLPGAEVLEDREFLDMTIITPANHGMEDAPFGYALVDGHLFMGVGSVKLLERTLYNLRESNEGLWNQSYLVKAIGDMPPNPVEVNYYNLGSALEDLYALYHSDIASELQGGWELPDISDFNMPYIILSTGYVLDDAQITRARVLPKNP